MCAATDQRMPTRPYRDGVDISIIGMGAIVLMGMDQAEADRTVAESVEQGVSYFDVAPSYGKGEAEAKLGPALEPFRDGVFLACKSHARDAEGARKHLEGSLRQLRTDHFDLYQFHGIPSLDEAEQILAPGGAAETFLKAREQGKVRFLGFSAHCEKAAMRMIEALGDELDSVLFPVNFVCIEKGDFGPRVLAEAKRRGLACLALKAMALTHWADDEERTHPKCWYRPVQDPDLAALALRYTLDQDITAAVPPGDERLYRLAVQTARTYTPLSEAERTRLLAAAEGAEPIFSA